MHRASPDRVAYRFLTAHQERPGPHWGPYPRSQVGRTLAGYIEYLEDLIRNDGTLFWDLYDTADERTFIAIAQLRDALKARKQAKAKDLVDHLMRSQVGKGIVDDNMLWSYVLDGRESL
jgi:hypothetical protein